MVPLLACVLVLSSATGQTSVTPAAAGASSQTAPTPPAPDTLAALVAELDRNNPDLEAARRDVDMRAARIAPAGALPDPTFSVSSITNAATHCSIICQRIRRSWLRPRRCRGAMRSQLIPFTKCAIGDYGGCKFRARTGTARR